MNETQDKFDALRSETVSVAGAKVAALLDEIGTHRTFLSALQDELNLILTDYETELSSGARRTLLWANQQIHRALS